MEVFGIKLVGINYENGQKVLLTIFTIFIVVAFKKLITFAIWKVYSRSQKRQSVRFWSRQALNLLSAIVIVLMFLSIWFDNPTRLATGLGLVTAGLAFALQKVVTSFAGYLMIMRGNTFSVGERITMGGIRGDVIELNFLQTTIMEMGQPPAVQGADPAMWIKGRQFTGRIVTVTNDKIFENPVFNYTRGFPFIWEEINLPIKYNADRRIAETILLESVNKHVKVVHQKSKPLREDLDRKYGVKTSDMIPKVFYRLTDNWLELSVRFIVSEHGIRDIKDKILRDLLEKLESNNIEIASTTIEVVGIPKVEFASFGMIDKKNVQKDARQ
ncbi:MAG: mechanosensitive ion channel family protein [Bacteriovoracaceae bacterium]|nr:mechanosensitive ion channel family protein [Bacteriovoracaceae bacterium]